jgi:hypothetical protein
MSDQQCSICKFFRPVPLETRGGVCCHNPPFAVPVPSQAGGVGFVGIFPPVRNEEWCGKWERNEVTH